MSARGGRDDVLRAGARSGGGLTCSGEGAARRSGGEVEPRDEVAFLGGGSSTWAVPGRRGWTGTIGGGARARWCNISDV
jgi:hypothetical protein